jgi:hypothetical protein
VSVSWPLLAAANWKKSWSLVLPIVPLTWSVVESVKRRGGRSAEP